MTAALGLAATPVFAFMATLLAMEGIPSAELLCGGHLAGWPFDRMSTMYLLMAAIHSPPWWRLCLGGSFSEPRS